MSGSERIAPTISSQYEDEEHGTNKPEAGPDYRERGTGMRKCYEAVARFVDREDGPTAVEYAVMLALIITVCIASITVLGQNTNNVFGGAALNAAAKSSSS